MAQSLTYAQLEQLRGMVNSGNVEGFYDHMAGIGYNYATLANGLVSGTSFSGEAAINYLLENAESQGVPFLTEQIPDLETQMANAWITALEGVAGPTGTVSADLSYQQTLAFHESVFMTFGLAPEAWTLYEPGQALDPATMESDWQNMLSQMSTPVIGPGQSELQLFLQMSDVAAQGSPSSAAALLWIKQNALNAPSDFADVFSNAFSSTEVSVSDGGAEYTDSSGNTLIRYTSTYSIPDPNTGGTFTETEEVNVWDMPVTTPTVTVAYLPDSTTVDESANANASVSSSGALNVSASSITVTDDSVTAAVPSLSIIGSGNTISVGAGASITVSLSDNNTIQNTASGQTISVSGGTISVSGSSEVVTAGATNQITVNADGSQTITVSDDSGNKTESVDVTSGGTTTDSIYEPTTGNLISQDVSDPNLGTLTYFYSYSPLPGNDTPVLYAIETYLGDSWIGGEQLQYQNGVLVGYKVGGYARSLDADNASITLQLGIGSEFQYAVQFAFSGTGDTVSGGTATFESSNSTLNLSDAQVVLAGTGDVISILASGNVITLDAGVGTTIGASSFANQSGTTIGLGAGNAVTLSSGVGYQINANGDVAGGRTSDGQATGITLGAGVQASMSGSGNSIVMAAGAGLSGARNSEITILGTGNPQQTTITVSSGNMIDAAAGSVLSLTGGSSGNTINTGEGSVLSLAGGSSGNTINIGEGSVLSVNGTDNIINAGAGTALTLNGDANQVSGVELTITSGTAAALQLGADTSANITGVRAITAAAGDSITVGGSNSTIAIDASNLSGGGAGITFEQNVAATIDGGGDAITVAGGNALTVSGATIALTANGASISGVNNAITASGVTINGIVGGNNTLTGGNDTIVSTPQPYSTGSIVTLSGTGYVLAGRGARVTLTAGSGVTVTDTSASITADVDASVVIDEGAGVALTKNGGTAITVLSGANLTVYGSDNTIDSASSDYIVANGSTIILSGSDSTIVGSTDIVQALDGLNISLSYGYQDRLIGDDETVTSFMGDLTLAGTGDIVSVASGAITLEADESVIASGGSSTINAVAGDSLTVNYTSGFNADVINANNVAAGGFTSDGQPTGITLGVKAAATIVGSGNTITALGNNTITANSDTLLANGSGIVLTGSGDTIQLGTVAAGIQIKGSGEILTFTDEATLASLKASAGNSGSDLIVTDSVTGSQITLTGMLSQNGAGAQQLTLTDGTTLSALQMVNLETTGTLGNDTLYGWVEGGNLFDGQGGNDLAIGHGNGDVFVFNQDYGSLEIKESDSSASPDNVLKLGAGITQSSLTVTVDASGNDLILTDGVSGDQIILDNMAASSTSSTSYTAGVQQIEFADGTTLSASQLIQMETRTLSGTSGSDTLTGTAPATLFDGEGGNDIETGNGGNDTFVFNTGYGQLTVNETYASGATPVLKLGTGITESNTEISSTDSDIIVSDGIAGDQITLTGMASGTGNGVQQIQFADGTTLNAAQIQTIAAHTLIGTSGNDSLNGTSTAELYDGRGGNDWEQGQGSADTFVFNAGYGQLEINEWDDSANPANVLRLGAGISESSVVLSSVDGSELILTDGITGDQIVVDGMLSSDVSGVQSLQFADGTVWTRAQILATEATDENTLVQVNGTAGTDTLSSSTGQSAIFDGKGGSDFESGTGQNDVFVFNAGYGALEVNQWNNDPTSDNSVLKLGAGISAASTSVFTTDGSEIMLTDGVTGDQIQIDGMYSSANSGVSAIEFADGTVWTRAQILAMAPYDGASGYAETLKGNTGNNIFDSEGSKDKETGAGGDDTYLLKAGYNTVTIVNGIAANNVAEGDLSIANMNPDNIWLQQVGNNLQIDIMGSKTEATIQGWFTNTYNQLSEITVSGGSGGNMTLDTQVSQLVQAMATYSADHTAFNPQASANPQITDPTLLSAVSTAWHHA